MAWRAFNGRFFFFAFRTACACRLGFANLSSQGAKNDQPSFTKFNLNFRLFFTIFFIKRVDLCRWLDIIALLTKRNYTMTINEIILLIMLGFLNIAFFGGIALAFLFDFSE